MHKTNNVLGLDIGTVRVGVAVADTMVRIAIPLDTIAMDEAKFADDIAKIVARHDITTIVVGYPRNQSGETTKQTEYIEKKAAKLAGIGPEVVFQDESLTSVIAEERLGSARTKVNKNLVDAEAAAILLQDYLESRR